MKQKKQKVVSNLYPNGMCTGCRRFMPLAELFNHLLKNGDCPDERGLFALPPEKACDCNGVEHVPHHPRVRFAREVMGLRLLSWQERYLAASPNSATEIPKRPGMKTLNGVIEAYGAKLLADQRSKR